MPRKTSRWEQVTSAWYREVEEEAATMVENGESPDPAFAMAAELVNRRRKMRNMTAEQLMSSARDKSERG